MSLRVTLLAAFTYALLAVLMELAVRGVNLTRIESRPTGERLGRYAFFLDCTGHVAEARVGEAPVGSPSETKKTISGRISKASARPRSARVPWWKFRSSSSSLGFL